jgi:hypothetical protein
MLAIVYVPYGFQLLAAQAAHRSSPIVLVVLDVGIPQLV